MQQRYGLQLYSFIHEPYSFVIICKKYLTTLYTQVLKYENTILFCKEKREVKTESKYKYYISLKFLIYKNVYFIQY